MKFLSFFQRKSPPSAAPVQAEPGLDPAKVFRVGSYPDRTFVHRNVEAVQRLETALAGGGQIICISGPSKVGKTVLCKNLIGDRQLIRIPGGQIGSYAQFIGLVAAQLGLSAEIIVRKLYGAQAQVSADMNAKLGITKGPIAFEVGGGGSVEKGHTTEDETTATIRAYLEHEVFEVLSNSDRYLLIDDFHRVDADTQEKIVSASKDYLVSGQFRLILASIPSHAYAPIQQNREMIGRFVHIAIPAWTAPELSKIAEAGFALLGWRPPREAVRQMARYAYGNPLLMQAMCLECVSQDKANGGRRELNVDRALRSLVGTYAPAYDSLIDGAQGRHWKLAQSGKDVPLAKVVFLSISEYPSSHNLSMTKSLLPVAQKLVAGGSGIKAADVQNVLKSALQRANAAHKGQAALPFEIDRTGGNVVVSDPYFRFYLQWSLRPRLGFPAKDSAPPASQAGQDDTI